MHESTAKRTVRTASTYVAEIRDSLTKTLPTEEAALALGRQAQTLRRWASDGSGPIQPIRIHGRLHWRAADIERLLRGEA